MGLFGKSNTTTNKSKQKKRPMFGTNKKPTFGIELESPTVNSGDVLNGKVWADIPSELKGTRMQVDFYGKEETKVRYEESESYRDSDGDQQTRHVTRHAYSTRDIFRISWPIMQRLSFNTANGKIQPGQYVIPFSVT